MSDHRHTPRYKEAANVIVKVQTTPADVYKAAEWTSYQTKNISLTGMQLSVDANIPQGAILELDIHLDHIMGNFHQLGSVVWCRGRIAHDIDAQVYHDIGVQFNAYANPHYQEWAEAVSTLIKKHRKFEPTQPIYHPGQSTMV